MQLRVRRKRLEEFGSKRVKGFVGKAKLKAREEKERSITVMLSVVVLTFLLCQTPQYSMFILEAFSKCGWEASKFYLIPIDLFLITTNSSVNFLIYYMFGTKFREQLVIVWRNWMAYSCFRKFLNYHLKQFKNLSSSQVCSLQKMLRLIVICCR